MLATKEVVNPTLKGTFTASSSPFATFDFSPRRSNHRSELVSITTLLDQLDQSPSVQPMLELEPEDAQSISVAAFKNALQAQYISVCTHVKTSHSIELANSSRKTFLRKRSGGLRKRSVESSRDKSSLSSQTSCSCTCTRFDHAFQPEWKCLGLYARGEGRRAVAFLSRDVIVGAKTGACSARRSDSSDDDSSLEQPRDHHVDEGVVEMSPVNQERSFEVDGQSEWCDRGYASCPDSRTIGFADDFGWLALPV